MLVTVSELVQDLGLSHGIIQELGFHKVCARCALGPLSEDHKAQRMVSALSFLQQYAIHDRDFLERIVTGDETWVHHHFPETKRASLEWKNPGSQRSEKFKMAKCADKVMATVFWDRRGVLLADFVEKAPTINAASYYATLEGLRTAIKKRLGLLTTGVLFLRDSVRTHVATAIRHLRRFRWTILGTSAIQRRCGAEGFPPPSRF